MILRRYKITVKEEPEFAGETFEQKRQRVLKYNLGITIQSVISFISSLLRGRQLTIAAVDRSGCLWYSQEGSEAHSILGLRLSKKFKDTPGYILVQSPQPHLPLSHPLNLFCISD